MAEMQPLVPTNERINQFKLPQGNKFFKCERSELLSLCEARQCISYPQLSQQCHNGNYLGVKKRHSKKKKRSGSLCFPMLIEFVLAVAICIQRSDLEIHGGLGQEGNENIKKFWKYIFFNHIFLNDLYISYTSQVSILQQLYILIKEEWFCAFESNKLYVQCRIGCCDLYLCSLLQFLF